MKDHMKDKEEEEIRLIDQQILQQIEGFYNL